MKKKKPKCASCGATDPRPDNGCWTEFHEQARPSTSFSHELEQFALPAHLHRAVDIAFGYVIDNAHETAFELRDEESPSVTAYWDDVVQLLADEDMEELRGLPVYNAMWRKLDPRVTFEVGKQFDNSLDSFRATRKNPSSPLARAKLLCRSCNRPAGQGATAKDNHGYATCKACASARGLRSNPGKPKSKPGKSEFAAHRRGNSTLYVEWFSVPQAQRGKGRGRVAWLEVERSLPADITDIELHAADSGTGATDGFWQSVGFDWVHQSSDEDELSYEDQHFMRKKRTEFSKPLPKKDPWRNQTQDIAEAMGHLSDFDENGDDYTWTITRHPAMAISKVATFDDLKGWLCWEKDELKGLSQQELFDECRRFRGALWAERALEWVAQSDFPAIVVVKTPEYQGIADGRGRLSVLWGLGKRTVPVLVVTAAPLPHQRPKRPA